MDCTVFTPAAIVRVSPRCSARDMSAMAFVDGGFSTMYGLLKSSAHEGDQAVA